MYLEILGFIFINWENSRTIFSSESSADKGVGLELLRSRVLINSLSKLKVNGSSTISDFQLLSFLNGEDSNDRKCFFFFNFPPFFLLA